MSDITPFHFGEFNVRVIQDENGDPWFIAKDVADALGYSHTSKAINTHCRGVKTCPTEMGGQVRHVQAIPERDVYRLIMRSKLPSAEKFEEWVVGEVLPSIRKHGMYATPSTIEAMISNPAAVIKILQTLQEEREQRRELEVKSGHLEAERAQLLPKAEAADVFLEGGNALTMNEVSKALFEKFKIGRNKLFSVMRERNVLTKNNVPRQMYMEQGYFRVIMNSIVMGSTVEIKPQTLVTAKGMFFISKLLDVDYDSLKESIFP